MREEGEIKVPVSYAGVTRIRFDGSALNLSARTGPPTVVKEIAGDEAELKPHGSDCWSEV